MKRAIAITILMIIPAGLVAQQLSVSPTSVRAWGAMPATTRIAVSYDIVDAVHLYSHKTLRDINGMVSHGGYFGVFINPLNFDSKGFKAQGGIGYMFRRFPTLSGRNLNFQAKLTYMLTGSMGVQYSHLSSGFSLFSDVNPGVDSISLVINFN